MNAPYCPCAGRCHHELWPCSFSCLATEVGMMRQESEVDVERLATALMGTVGTLGWLRSTPSDPIEEWRLNAQRVAAYYDRLQPAAGVIARGVLDDAWREAESALPVTWDLALERTLDGRYRASASGTAASVEREAGTPVNALRDLIDALRPLAAGADEYEVGIHGEVVRSHMSGDVREIDEVRLKGVSIVSTPTTDPPG